VGHDRGKRDERPGRGGEISQTTRLREELSRAIGLSQSLSWERPALLPPGTRVGKAFTNYTLGGDFGFPCAGNLKNSHFAVPSSDGPFCKNQYGLEEARKGGSAQNWVSEGGGGTVGETPDRGNLDVTIHGEAVRTRTLDR